MTCGDDHVKVAIASDAEHYRAHRFEGLVFPSGTPRRRQRVAQKGPVLNRSAHSISVKAPTLDYRTGDFLVTGFQNPKTDTIAFSLVVKGLQHYAQNISRLILDLRGRGESVLLRCSRSGFSELTLFNEGIDE